MRWFKDADGKTKFAPDFNLFSRKYFLLQKHVGCILNLYDMNTVKYTQKDKLQSWSILQFGYRKSPWIGCPRVRGRFLGPRSRKKILGISLRL